MGWYKRLYENSYSVRKIIRPNPYSIKGDMDSIWIIKWSLHRLLFLRGLLAELSLGGPLNGPLGISLDVLDRFLNRPLQGYLRFRIGLDLFLERHLDTLIFFQKPDNIWRRSEYFFDGLKTPIYLTGFNLAV